MHVRGRGMRRAWEGYNGQIQRTEREGAKGEGATKEEREREPQKKRGRGSHRGREGEGATKEEREREPALRIDKG
jgi:hypothetical protein